MYKNIKFSASIMYIDWMQALNQIRELELSNIDYLHIDILDGRFAPDFTLGTSIINSFVQNSSLPLDYHLMVDEPNYLYDTFQINKNTIYTIHQECCKNLHREIVSIRNKNVGKVGVALSPATPLEYLEYIIEDIDLILLMTSNPGSTNQDLIPQTIRKISDLKNKINKMKLKTLISVDGNVNNKNIPDIVSAGADVLVLGPDALFKKNTKIRESIETIKKAIDKAIF